ncbi:hypothetical protein C8R48DRAFT_728465 [Suillus tomentosus]|nr:hypothetical protein C8R48DRAFT_728465 [Suillus tomentosus]
MCQRPDGYLLWFTLFPYLSHPLSSLGLAFQFGMAQVSLFQRWYLEGVYFAGVNFILRFHSLAYLVLILHQKSLPD